MGINDTRDVTLDRRFHNLQWAQFRIFLLRIVAFLFLPFCFSCSFLNPGITYYDATTYKSLTDLKPQVVLLYQSLVDDSIDTREIRDIRLKLNQMLEYEKGKGLKNHETAEQIKIIRDMFENDIQHRMKNGKWSVAQMNNQVENISDAFDIAISTERLKNKNE